MKNKKSKKIKLPKILWSDWPEDFRNEAINGYRAPDWRKSKDLTKGGKP